MSIDMRAFRYPLEALHKREGWRLDTLRAELAAATRRHDTERERHHAIERDQHAAAVAARPVVSAAIDPAAALGRLAYLGELRTRLLTAAGVLQGIERERDRLRGDSRRQQARLEAIAEHRAACRQSEATRASARQAVESDSDWLIARHGRNGFEERAGGNDE